MRTQIKKFVVEDEEKDDDKGKDQEADNSISNTNQSLYANVHDSAKITTLTVKMKKSMNPVMPWTVLLQAKM